MTTPPICIIAAIARGIKNNQKPIVNKRKPISSKDKRAIGINNTLPWHIPEDLANFKRLTFGQPIIMGRKTYDSIGRPLPGRFNIVISRDAALQIAGCHIVHSLEEAIVVARQQNPQQIFIIGGAQIYAQAMAHADYLYLTEIDKDVEGDAFFPLVSSKIWQETKRQKLSSCPLLKGKEIHFHFAVYKKIS